MNKLQISVCAVAAYVLLVVGFGIASSPPATGQGNGNGQPPGPDVRVINSASEPVPVVGEVAITGEVELKAGGKVGIDPANNTVTVGNTAANPVLVQQVGSVQSEPFQARAITQLTEVVSIVQLYTVPAGKRLTIENAAATVDVGAGTPARFTLLVTEGGPPGYSEPLVSYYQGGRGVLDSFAANHKVLAFAEAGQKVAIYVERNESVSRFATGSISGWLSDL